VQIAILGTHAVGMSTLVAELQRDLGWYETVQRREAAGDSPAA
jgi:nicotinamide riboside kinase